MRRKRVVVGIVALVAVAVVAVLFWPVRRPCLATFEQVHKGMTLEEVIRTVGGPPTKSFRNTNPGLPEPYNVSEWDGYDGYLYVAFGDDGRAKVVTTATRLRPANFWNRLLDDRNPF